ncbi:MAG: hypothetical protein PUC25_03400 [Prevotellaceae bacterium]|nr:hypothetical protein [Prevotellaceae bacterium]
MIENTLNLSSDNVKDMQAESPAKESKETVADRIPKLPKNVHWAVKAIVEPFPEDRKEVMSLMALPFLGMLGGYARFLYRNQEEHHLGFECCFVGGVTFFRNVTLCYAENAVPREVIFVP